MIDRRRIFGLNKGLRPNLMPAIFACAARWILSLRCCQTPLRELSAQTAKSLDIQIKCGEGVPAVLFLS
jgi:hypothetical protein